VENAPENSFNRGQIIHSLLDGGAGLIDGFEAKKSMKSIWNPSEALSLLTHRAIFFMIIEFGGRVDRLAQC
jgi:hypothetical protein